MIVKICTTQQVYLFLLTSSMHELSCRRTRAREHTNTESIPLHVTAGSMSLVFSNPPLGVDTARSFALSCRFWGLSGGEHCLGARGGLTSAASLKLAQMVVERLDVGEDAHGVWFTAHDHHIVHLDEAVTAGLQLCGPKSQLEVVLSVGWRQRAVVELGGEEGVNQGTESHSVAPTG